MIFFFSEHLAMVLDLRHGNMEPPGIKRDYIDFYISLEPKGGCTQWLRVG